MQLILDNIRSAGNIGSMFRTGDAFSIDKIFICGISATPPNKEILKTALGATETIAWEYREHTSDLIQELKQDNHNVIVAAEQSESSVPLNQFMIPEGKNIILILGNEVDGVSPEILDQCDAVVEIPQFGKKKSLNVSVAGGIVLWEFYKLKNLNT